MCQQRAYSDTPLDQSRGFFLHPGGSRVGIATNTWRPSVQKRSRLPGCSRVPHGTGETGFSFKERSEQAARRVCALLRDSTQPLSCFGKHVRAFLQGTSPWNPPKRDSVVKVLEQVYYKGAYMSSETAREVSSLEASGGRFIPRLERQELSRPFPVNDRGIL